MPVRCPECGYDNRDNYRFCGMCGAGLRAASVPQRKASVREQAVVTETPPPPRNVAAREINSRQETSAVSGPSFLGLADAPARRDVQYLLEDEESHSGGRRMLMAFLLLVVAGGLLYWHWSRDGFPWSAGSSHPAQAPVFSGASNAPAPAEPLPPPSNQAAHPDTPPSVPSADEAHMTKSDDVPPKESAPAPAAKPAADNSEQGLAPALPDTPKSAPPAANSPAADASDDSAAADTPAPKPTVPAKPVRSSATKPAQPTQPAVSNDDQLVADGEKYLYGNGVPTNCDRAQKNLRVAAGHGNSRALSMLGTMYATGHCADRDLPNAYRSFAKALHLDPNNSRIQSDLEILWRQMTPDERQAATHGN